MRKYDTHSIVEGALLSAITIIISLAALYLPIIGVFASLIWPVPIIILGIRHGKVSILATIVSGVIVAMIEGPVHALTVVLGFGLIGIVMGWAIRKQYEPFKVLAIGAMASLVSKVILISISLFIMGINPIAEEIAIMRESISMVESMYGKMGVSPENLKTITQSFSKMIDLMAVAIPAILVLASLLDAFLSYVVTRGILSRLGQKLKGFTPFWMWRFPAYTVFLFLVGVLLAMIEAYWPHGILKTIGINLQMIFYFLFLIQGFSLMAYFMGKYNVAKILRVIAVLLAFFNPLFSQLVMWSGMFDILFNFRQI